MIGGPLMMNFGRYQVVRMLGKIAGEDVFLGQTIDAHGGEYHVVRRIQDSAFENARRAVRLRHRNLISVRELGAEVGRWYIAAEYVHGEDLRRLLARVRRGDDQVPISIVAAIGIAVASGLHHAHTHQGPRRAWRGVIHGGVTPASIVIGYDGTIKLGEVGVAIGADPSYQAPEQVAGGPIDRRTDVFALGAVLYELATARRLFRAPSDALTRAAIAEPNIPAPSRFRRGLPRALEDIILKALAPAPEARFRSAAELRAALEAFMRRIGLRQTPAGIADYLKQTFGTRPFPWVPSARPQQAPGLLPDLLDDGQLGVAAPPDSALRELGVPEARALEATPSRGTRTPMSWMSQTPPPAPPSPRRRIAIIAGAATAVAAALAFIVVGALARGGDRELAPAIAPPPPVELAPAIAPPLPLPPPPPPPIEPVIPSEAQPDAISGEGAIVPSARSPEPAPPPRAGKARAR
jgi:serine/threonine-protein kinase